MRNNQNKPSSSVQYGKESKAFPIVTYNLNRKDKH